MTAQEIIKEIQKARLSSADLRLINGFVVDSIKAERKVQNAVAKAVLEVGMNVVVNHPQLAGREFELVAIKRTKASVRPRGEMFGGYNVPLNLVEQA